MFGISLYELLLIMVIILLVFGPERLPEAASRECIRKLLSDYPGQYTFFLANESVLFGFSNSRRLLLLKKTEKLGDILLVTSVKERLSPDDWHAIEVDENSQGKLLVMAGPDVLYLDDI